MDQLIKMIQDRTGIDEGKARTAAETAIGFIKDRLPDPIAGQVDSAVSGSGSGSGEGQSPMDKVGGMLGR